MHVSGQFFAHFGVAADGDAARMVLAGLRRLRSRCAVHDFAGRGRADVFRVALVVGVADVEADGFVFVRSAHGVGRAGRALNGYAICHPLVFDAGCGDAVRVVDVGAQGLPDFRIACNDRAPFGIAARRAVVIGDSDGRLVTDLTRVVADGVLHRGRVADEIGFRGEGDFAEADVPFALSGDGQFGDGFARRIQQADAARIEVALTVGVHAAVVIQHVNGDFFLRCAFDLVVICNRFRVAAGLVWRRRLRDGVR